MTSNRRTFFKSTALLAAPAFIPNLRAVSPNGKIRHASIGCGGQAWSDLGAFSSHPDFELVAVADVDTRNFDHAKKKFPNVRTYQSWKELLEKEKDLDSVNVSIPDHMHGLVTVTALNRGLHTYTQKPLTQNLWECRQLMVKAREKKAITQMGIQISSAFTERHAVEYIHGGVIGKVKEVHTFSSKTWGDPNPLPEGKSDVPPTELDWDLWLGVAAKRPYLNGYYHPGNWRKRRDFGTGTLGDMGCHMFSGWFRALDLKIPLSVNSTGPAAGKDNWAINGQVEYIFQGTQYTAADTVKVVWYDGSQRPPKEIVDQVGGRCPDQGSIYIGTEGAMVAPHMSTPMLFPQEKFKDKRPAKLEPRDHYHDFLNCVKDGKTQPSANFDYASPLTEAVLLGCLASVFPNEVLKWDSAKLTFTNAEATKLVRRNYRESWEWPA